ncbi:hypothetical protein Egran_06044 [Elaphomyces granulatus]|uniref:Cwf19-like C-terminal domain-containing protein n=1 Tax=Elaphomyces granulatus TaxID=519963 RepID=A0A232LQB4_9EURO|nr:hypothetical protein Egran_06044 [Elaphomyces granulatus]
MASKIVVLGNINGALQEVFTRLAKLHIKQSFSFAIVVGDLFGDCSSEQELDEISSLLKGSITVPLPTYFTVGSRPIPTRIVDKIESDDELCPNLYFLGRRGTLKTSEGIRLTALGGELTTDTSADAKANSKYHCRYTEPDARSLYGVHSTDILITYQWPKGIRSGSSVPFPEDARPQEIQCIADVCSTLKPRYHFSSCEDFFFEREPFFHTPSDSAPETNPLTRFINLASFSKISKQKWMYAFILDPKAPSPTSIPAGATATPLSGVPTRRRPFPSQNASYQRFSQDNDFQQPRKRTRRLPPGPEACFFCLSNPDLATHLITSIGNESYLTTAKGPLTTAETLPSLGFPGHILIIPLVHSPTFRGFSDDASRSATYHEMQRYRSSLHAMLRQRAKDELGSVTWEVSRGNGVHIHWQFLPVSSSLIDRGLVEAAFKVEAENLQYPKFQELTADDGEIDAEDYFRVWVWSPLDSEPKDTPSSDRSSTLSKTLILHLTPEFRFDLQFGRRVMAKLLQLENRLNWRDAVQSKDEEDVDVQSFKAAFKAYDISLEAD